VALHHRVDVLGGEHRDPGVRGAQTDATLEAITPGPARRAPGSPRSRWRRPCAAGAGTPRRPAGPRSGPPSPAACGRRPARPPPWRAAHLLDLPRPARDQHQHRVVGRGGDVGLHLGLEVPASPSTPRSTTQLRPPNSDAVRSSGRCSVSDTSWIATSSSGSSARRRSSCRSSSRCSSRSSSPTRSRKGASREASDHPVTVPARGAPPRPSAASAPPPAPCLPGRSAGPRLPRSSSTASTSGCGCPCRLSRPALISATCAPVASRNAGSLVAPPWWGTANSSTVRSVPGQQRRLCLPLRVAGEQRPPSLVAHAQDRRGLVEFAPRVPVGASGGWAEHLDHEVAEHHPVPCRHVAHRDPARGRLRQQLGRLRQLGRHRPVPDRPDVQPPQHLRRAAHVVEVAVGHDQQVERGAAVLPQPAGGGRVLAGVDEHPRGRGLDQVGVPLAHVDRRDREPRTEAGATRTCGTPAAATSATHVTSATRAAASAAPAAATRTRPAAPPA
jgi:hypothetical protein